MSNGKLASLYKLMTRHNFQFDNEMLSDNLKCAECRSVLKDACQLPCGCTFCRACINEMVANGSSTCPGISEICGETLLSDAVSDYRLNNTISKVTVSCPFNECCYKCQLASIEDHLRICERRSVECPFFGLGCTTDKLDAREMRDHFQQEIHNHSEIVIGVIADINRRLDGNCGQIEKVNQNVDGNRSEMNMLMQTGEENKREIERLKRNEERHEREIEMLKRNLEGNKKEIEIIRLELELKDREIRIILNENKSIKDEMKSIMNQNKSICGENKSINGENKSIKTPTGQEQSDASCELVIDEDVSDTSWGWGDKTSDYFIGTGLPYKYRLASGNYGSTGNLLEICLRIYPSSNDSRLPWPFKGLVNVTVSDKSRREACRSIDRQCEIKRPPGNCCRSSDNFVFPHCDLTAAGVDLCDGIHVSCVIFLGGDR